MYFKHCIAECSIFQCTAPWGNFVKTDVLLSASQIMINTALVPVKLAVPSRQLLEFIILGKKLYYNRQFQMFYEANLDVIKLTLRWRGRVRS